MSIVLFDGSQPAIKALEAGAAPSFFGHHSKQQLVVIHATKPKASVATAGADGNSSSDDNNNSGNNHQHHQDSSSSSGGGGGGNTTTTTNTPNPYTVIPMISELITKNRHAASSLNYKTETFRLFAGPPISAAEERQREQELLAQIQQQQQSNTKGGGSKGGNSAAQTAAALLAQQQAAAAALLKEKQQQDDTNNNSSDENNNNNNNSNNNAYTLQSNFADSIAIRARHHNLRSVLLGVGSSGSHGKALAIGSFARAVIDRLRGKPETTGIDVVGIFKPSGPPVRATQPMRVTIVVNPDTTFTDIQQNIMKRLPCLSQQRGDYVSLFVVMNDGKAKPSSLVTALKDIEANRQQQIALGQQNIQAVPTSEEQLDLIKFDDDEESNSGSYWKSKIEKIRQLAKNVAALGFLNQEERIRRDKEEELEAAKKEQDYLSGNNNVIAPSVVGGGYAGGVNNNNNATSSFEGPSLLNCFWIEPTNRDHSPSLESTTGCIQFSKGVGAIKIDYAVVAGEDISGVGESATNSLLSANRPHVLLL